MSAEKCNNLIYKYGDTIVANNMSKEEAEKACKDATRDSSEFDYDWHFAGGRTIVKRLAKNFDIESTPEALKRDALLYRQMRDAASKEAS